MAQTSSKTPTSLEAYSGAAVAIPQTGNTVFLTLDVRDMTYLAFQVAVAAQDLDAFVIEGRTHQDAPYFTIANSAGDFTSPAGFMIKASASLVTLAAAGTGWVLMDVRGLTDVRLSASSGNVAGSTITAYAQARK